MWIEPEYNPSLHYSVISGLFRLFQNVDLYSALIFSKPVYSDIVQDNPLFLDSDSA